MFYWNLVDEKAKSVLFRLRDAGLLRGYYLTGGTGLALQLGHRVSRDLDLFTKRPTEHISARSIITGCEEVFGRGREVVVRINQRNQVWLDIDGVSVTFLGFPFRLKYPPVESRGVEIADLRDIALQKAYVIGRRAHARDYIDLVYILETGKITLDQIIRNAREVFKINGEPVFSPRLFLQQLTYTEDLTDKEEALKLLVRKRSFDDIRDALNTYVSQLVRSTTRQSHQGRDAKPKPRKALRDWPYGFVKSSTGVVHLIANRMGTRSLCGRTWPKSLVVTNIGSRRVDFCDVCKRIAGVR